MKKTLLLWLFGLLLTSQVFAQNRSLSGTVKDATTGEALIGVNVTGKGTTIGTVTDIDGKYTVELPKDVTVIVFSYIGYTNLEKPILSLVLNASMSAEGKQLEEVVVTALAIERNKNSVGFANQTVKSEDLNVVTNRSVLDALKGKVAGVKISSASGAPGASTRIVLRGETSLTGNNNALIVVDGIPVNNSAVAGNQGVGDESSYIDFGNRGNDINPDDVESVTVLKGPAATTLYGSRGASGVVLITTKKGVDMSKKGGRPFKVSVGTSLTFENPYIVLKRQDQFGQGYGSSAGAIASSIFYTGENFSWGPKLDGVVRPWTSPVLINGIKTSLSKPYSAIKNQLASFFDLGITNKNTLSIEGGSDKYNYRVSYNHFNTKGVVPNTYLKRHSLQVNSTAKFADNITADFTLSYAKTNQRAMGEGVSFEQANGGSAYQMAVQTAVDIPFDELRDYNSPFHDLNGYYGSFTANPYFILAKTINTNDVDNVLGKIAINYKPIKDLTLTARIGDNYINSIVDERVPKYNYATQEVWVDGHLETVERGKGSPTPDNYSDGRYTLSTDKINELTVDVLAQYNKELGKKKNFKIGLLGGFNSFSRTQSGLRSYTVGGLVVPDFYDLSNSFEPARAENSGVDKYRIMGVYGNLSVGYKNLVYLEYSARNDWSSTLPEGHRGFFYQAGSVSFVPTELFKNPNKWLTYAKIRANVGTTGKDAPLQRTTSVFVSNPTIIDFGNPNFDIKGPVNGQPIYSVGNAIGNPNLKPELTITYEGGVDLSLFKDRLSINYTYYYADSRNQIVDVNLSAASGYTTQPVNVGRIINQGHELAITATPFKLDKGYSMDINFTFSKNDSKVKKIADGIDELTIDGLLAFTGMGSASIVAAVGQPFGTYKATGMKKDPNGNTVVDATGAPIVDNESKYVGSYQPKFLTSAGASVNIKGLTMSVLFDMKVGGKYVSYSKQGSDFNGTALETTLNDRELFVLPNSVIESSPGVFTPNTIPTSSYKIYSERLSMADLVVDASYVKLREVSIGYTLPSKLFKNIPLSGVSFNLMGRNLKYWLPKSNPYADPEVSGSGLNTNAVGIESLTTPSTRSFGFDVKVTF